MKNRIDLEKKEAVGQMKPCSSRLISEVQIKQGVRIFVEVKTFDLQSDKVHDIHERIMQ